MKMALQYLRDNYIEFQNAGDARANKLPFVKDPKYVILSTLSYLFIVYTGPKIMKNRQPFQLRGVLIIYNFLLVLLSLFMLYEIVRCSIFCPGFDLLFQGIDENDHSSLTMRLVYAHWLYTFSKFIEFLDTIFFILRKKNNQISFLHVYHHCSMLFLQWLALKFVPGGAWYFGLMCNCYVHVVMYAYYMLSAFGPHMQKYLWWKKYLTELQMIQFVFIICYITLGLMYMKQGWYFYFINWFYMWSFLYLFNRFYQNAYKEKQKQKQNEQYKQQQMNGHSNEYKNGHIKSDEQNGHIKAQ